MLLKAKGVDVENHPAKHDYDQSLKAFEKIQQAAKQSSSSSIPVAEVDDEKKEIPANLKRRRKN